MWKEDDMRKNLKEARQRAGMTQQEVAKYLGVTLRSYQRLESNIPQFLGRIKHWDALEDLFGIHQRVLRQVFPIQKNSEDKGK